MQVIGRERKDVGVMLLRFCTDDPCQTVLELLAFSVAFLCGGPWRRPTVRLHAQATGKWQQWQRTRYQLPRMPRVAGIVPLQYVEESRVTVIRLVAPLLGFIRLLDARR